MNTANHETMSTILLSGSLAKLFGRTHQRLIGPTREADYSNCSRHNREQKSWRTANNSRRCANCSGGCAEFYTLGSSFTIFL